MWNLAHKKETTVAGSLFENHFTEVEETVEDFSVNNTDLQLIMTILPLDKLSDI